MLQISEDFYSVQCEGPTTGYPAYFVRLTGCNLSCGASQKFINSLKKQETPTPGDFKGDLHDSGEATWTCDTIPVWIKGNNNQYNYLIDRWKNEGIYQNIINGNIHIIWTGGEPTIPKHQNAIIGFNDYMYGIEANFNATQAYQEIETNGTFVIKNDLLDVLSQVNCSAKLANSGMPKHRRVVPEAIASIMSHPNYWFKFVVSNEADIEEGFENYINPFNIPLERVVMMPGLDSQENFHERTRFILEAAKKYKFIGLTRLHVSAWDKTTGV